MIRLGVLFLVLVVLLDRTNALSRTQLKNSAKGMKKSCMNKIQVTEDMIGDIEKGKFIEDKKVMCYIACIYEMTNVRCLMTIDRTFGIPNIREYSSSPRIINRICPVIKNNKINYDACVKQVETMYPPDIKVSARAGVDHCKEVPKRYKDICEASFYAAKCMYEFKPEDFIFP